jgi:phosphoserine phosphatase
MRETIAVVFDFDDTLAPDSTSGFLNFCGVDVPSFWKDEVLPLLRDDWDPVPAYLYRMIEKARKGDCRGISREGFRAWGAELPLYEGVESIFDRLRETVRKKNPRVSVEFYLVSSGIGDILRHTSIAGQFSDIWASDFTYDADGTVLFPKRIVSFTDKTRYLFHVQKGIFGPDFRGKPFHVNKKVDDSNIRVPLNQMIFVGDGYTDIPCFSLVRKSGGIAIGVYDRENREKWGRAWGFIEDGRVSNLVPADYGEKSALSDSLIMAVESLANRISLAAHTYQG